MGDKESLEWRCRDRSFELVGHPLVMGILNVTSDSFSDGGRFSDAGAAIAHGLRMIEDGADIIDVGGESTRPGAREVEEQDELQKVIPVIQALARRTDAVVSVDTMKGEVARQAIMAGARIINDVSAMSHDPDMPDVAAEFRAGVILMHMQGTPRTMQRNPEYVDVVSEVRDCLHERVQTLAGRGLELKTMAIDPGIGFGKTVEHNVTLLTELDVFGALGLPVVVGLSRKSFLGKLTGRTVDERLAGSLAGLVFCVLKGANVLRVHDVRESRDAVNVLSSLK